MRLCSPVLAVFLVATCSMMVEAQDAPPPAPAESPAPPAEVEEEKIRELMVERRKTLEALLANTKAHYDTGRITITAVLQVEVEVLEASLELAEGKAERMAIHRKRLDLLIEIEKDAYARSQVDRMTVASYLKVKAQRLQAEIEMLREQKRK